VDRVNLAACAGFLPIPDNRSGSAGRPHSPYLPDPVELSAEVTNDGPSITETRRSP